MIICCPKTSDIPYTDFGGHGGGIINEKIVFLVLTLFSLTLFSPANKVVGEGRAPYMRRNHE